MAVQVNGNAREEAVGSPSIEGGTMAVSLQDPTSRLLDLEAQPLGTPTPPTPQATDGDRRNGSRR